jgi:N-glycosylase/DNA lyase
MAEVARVVVGAGRESTRRFHESPGGMRASPFVTRLKVRDYDLAATLDSGQAFRWRPDDHGWSGVVAGRWVRLTQADGDEIVAEAWTEPGNWDWLTQYLQVAVDLRAVVATFPDDPPLREAVEACWGLRLLRQEPWECLASFLMSSTKQIPQIRQIVAGLSHRFGTPVEGPHAEVPWTTFPSAANLASVGEAQLRSCRMGFRARYLRETAGRVADGQVRLETLGTLDRTAARAILMELPGVGPKIADCVLLFAYGFAEAFPVDVWILKALRGLYFAGREVSPAALGEFAIGHFGPHGGYAQQYLFHWMRLRAGRLQRPNRVGETVTNYGN